MQLNKIRLHNYIVTKCMIIGFAVMAMPCSYLLLIVIDTLLNKTSILITVSALTFFWICVITVLAVKGQRYYKQPDHHTDTSHSHLVPQISSILLILFLRKFKKFLSKS